MSAAPDMTALGEVLTAESPKRPLRLYEIADALESIEAALLDGGGEISEEMETALDAMEGELEKKAERICRVIRNNELSAKAFGDEIDRLSAHKSAHENAAKRLKTYLMTVMQRVGREKVDAGAFKVAIQNNSRPAIAWSLLPEQIPEPFQRVVPAHIELNSDAAYQAWKHDGSLPEGFQVAVGKHIRVR